MTCVLYADYGVVNVYMTCALSANCSVVSVHLAKLFLEIDQPETRIAHGSIYVNRSRQNELSL